jgi:hypothetical protein
MTTELLDWCASNKSWIELAVHGLFHSSNYECAHMTEEEFHDKISRFGFIEEYFVKGFRAPGWQISDGVYQWLLESGWWVADQAYNNDRRPKELRAWVNDNGQFTINDRDIKAVHGHVWDCMNNGIYEAFDMYADLVKDTDSFQFVSEAINENY